MINSTYETGRFLIIISLFSCLVSCNQNDKKVANLEKQVKELKQELKKVYKPGFGDIMGSIQTHHLKLWFSGSNKNWELAEFEIHEIEELFEDLEVYLADRNEAQYIPMIKPVLETLDKTIKEKNFEQFEKDFSLLTNTCNSCHTITNHDYIKIKIPDFQATINQAF